MPVVIFPTGVSVVLLATSVPVVLLATGVSVRAMPPKKNQSPAKKTQSPPKPVEEPLATSNINGAHYAKLHAAIQTIEEHGMCIGLKMDVPLPIQAGGPSGTIVIRLIDFSFANCNFSKKNKWKHDTSNLIKLSYSHST